MSNHTKMSSVAPPKLDDAVEPIAKPSLLEVLATLDPIEDEFPYIEDLPPRPI